MDDVKLSDLASASRKLNEASDILSRQIAEVEKFLNDLKLGVYASVRIASYSVEPESSSVPPYSQVESLAYGKHKGKWCLLFSVESDIDPSGDSVPLREAPREDRIRAVEKLPVLLAELDKRAADVAKQAEEKAANVAQLLAGLKR